MQNQNSSNWRGHIIGYTPILLWICVIFFLSSSNGSMSETSRFIGPLLKFLFPSAPKSTVLLIHQIVRKLAHVTEYSILGFLACRAFLRSPSAFLNSKWPLVAIGLVAVIASLDEFNQSFDVLRTSSPLDVLLDILGGAAATFVFYLWQSKRAKVTPDREPAGLGRE